MLKFVENHERIYITRKIKERIFLHKNIWKKSGILAMIAIFFMTINCELVYSINNDYKFKNVTIEEGLSQSSVETIFQDSQGYMWFGTDDGLDRYDGNKFKVFRYDFEDKNSISSNCINYMIESEQYLWVGTSNGLDKMDKNGKVIVEYKNDPKDKTTISNNNVWSMVEDNSGFIWVGTEKGLNKYDKNSGKFTGYFKGDHDDNSLSNNFVTCLCLDKEGLLWIGTKEGVNVYNKTTNTFKRYFASATDKSISNNYINTIYEDKKGTIWIGTESGGLNKFDKASGSFKVYSESNKHLPSNSVQVVFEDSYGNLWVGTKEGLCRYNKEKDNFTVYSNQCYDKHSIVNNDILSIYEDKSGMLWIGTVNGLSSFYPKQIFHSYTNDPFDKNSLSYDSIAGIYEDDDKLLWVGTVNKGLNLINRETNEVKLFLNDVNNLKSISNNYIKTITGDGKGNIWIATSGGLNKYNKLTGEFKRYIKDANNTNSLVNDEVRFLYFDSKKQLWIGTRSGLDLFNPDTEEFIHISDVLKKDGVDDYLITSVYEDSKGYIWLGCGINGGIIRVDRKNNSLKIYKNLPGDKSSLSCNGVKALTGDSQGNIWIATNYGLNKFNTNTEKFTVYTEKDGLCNNFVYAVLLDKSDNPWVSTNGGISKLDIKENKFYNFTMADGLPSNEFNGYSYHKSNSGEMFFGGINGVTNFYPEDFKANSYVPKVVIEDFKIFDKAAVIKDKIKLKYNENYFSLEFFIPDYKNLGKNQYAYMLEGVDKDWVYSNNRNYASYTNVKSGKYLFKVKGRNSCGMWSEPTEVTINVKNPPWRSWWAYIIYAVIIVLLMYIIYNYVSILEGLVKQRTIQLDNKLKENEELYKTLIKYEKVKNNYFINLSHELKTPLNVILSTFQLIEQFDKEKIPLTKENMDKYMGIMKRNSKSLLKVINDLIDTSKIDAGHYKLNITEIDIVYLVEEVALSMKDYIESNGIEFVIDPEIEEMTIECDANEIERCVVNLLSNAVKFTPNGGAIWVNLYDKEDTVEIAVKDTGIGIDEEHLKIIFDRFGQVDSDGMGKKIGSGIGLTLVKSLVSMHGGKIEVKSRINEGSEFIITLPKKHVGVEKNLIN